MSESPLLFSSVIPACGFCLEVQSRSRGVQKQGQVGGWADRGRGIGHPLPTASDGPQAGRWQRGPQRLDSSTYRPQNQGNKARMSMKTKEEVKKSRSCEARSRGQARRCLRVVTLRLLTLDSQLLDSNSTKQSENVYENKGQVQKVPRPRIRLTALSTLSKEAARPDSTLGVAGRRDIYSAVDDAGKRARHQL